MHQHQLLTYSTMFNLLTSTGGRVGQVGSSGNTPTDSDDNSDSGQPTQADRVLGSRVEHGQPIPSTKPQTAAFTSPDYDTMFSFLPPRKSKINKLTAVQLKHLQQHYRTTYSLLTLQHAELVKLNPQVEVWHRCQIDKTVFACARHRRKNSSRLNHLVCTVQAVDANARFKQRPTRMIPAEFYGYVQFYCVHEFRGKFHMLMYVSWRKIHVHDGLVEDLGHHCDGFQDIIAIQHMCAKVTGHGGKVYIVDEPEVAEERLRDDISDLLVAAD
jgi:hypothetical protein